MTLLVGNFEVKNYSTELRDTASLSDFFGLLAKERTYKIPDAKNFFNPFVPGSVLKENWRNLKVEEFSQGELVYSTRLHDVGYEFSSTRNTVLNSRDVLGTLLNWKVEEYSLVSGQGLSDAYWTQGGYASLHNDSIALLYSGNPPLPNALIGALVSFESNIIPRYVITRAQDTPRRIFLDRPLERGIIPNTVLRIMVPAFKTPAQAIRDALVAAGVDRIGNSFNLMHSLDAANNRYLRIFITKEQNVRLSEHLKTLCELASLYLYLDENNVVNLQPIEYDGGLIETTIDDDDIMLPITFYYNKTNLLYAYDCLFLNDNNVSVASNTVTSSILNQYAAKERWQPIEAKSTSPRDYNYLYNNQQTAAFFGSRRLNYYSYPRLRAKFSLKPFKSRNPKALFRLYVGKRFLFSFDFGNGKKLYREPVVVLSYNYDSEENFYRDVEVEFNNYLYPQRAVV